MTDGTIWQQIRSALRADIDQGRYKPGEKLPTEAALAKRFGVNRHTIRRALSELHAQGLTRSQRGSGVFVTARPMTYPLGPRVRFHATLEAAGQVPTKEIIRLETVAATAREAQMLDLAPGDPVHVWEGIAQADDVPVAFFHSWFPAARLPGLKEGLAETRSVTAALAGEGVRDYTRRSTKLTAERALPLLARHLRIAEGAPVIFALSVNVDGQGRPIEFGQTWFVGDRVRMTLDQ